MKTTAVITMIALLGLAGAASAGCVGESHTTTSASAETTILPSAAADDATATPIVLLPLGGAENEEG